MSYQESCSRMRVSVYIMLACAAFVMALGRPASGVEGEKTGVSSGSGRVLKDYGGDVSAVMDLDHDLQCFLHSPELLKKKMAVLAGCGIKRLYIIAPPPGNPDYSTRVLPQDGPPNFLRQSREALGNDPLALAAALAKEAGMDVFIQFKPYEGGGVKTVPHGFVPPCNRNWIKTLGGRAVGLDPFIIEHPEMRLKRKAADNRLEYTGDRIEMVFVLDRIAGREGLQVKNGKMKIVLRPDLPAIGADAITRYPASNFVIYLSSNNGTYKPYPDKFRVSEHLERRLIRSANGELIFPNAVLCRVIELSGLKLSSPYFAVSFDGDKSAFRTIPFSQSCMALYSGEMRLPITVSSRVRDGQLTHKYGFKANGFEFEEQGPYYWDYGWRRQCQFGFARGKTQYIRGELCEAYPEVRNHWLAQIQRYVDIGCDGVDIRLQSHSSGITDFVNYGYNQPLVDAYEKKYNTDITKCGLDPIKMMRLRGDFMLMFLRDAAAILHGRGLILQMHLNDYDEHPTLDPSFPGAGFWASPKVVPKWQSVIDIVDEITIKDYNWGVYNPYMSGRIKTAVAALTKPLWVTCYMQQGHDLNEKFLSEVSSDRRVTGLMLYETVYRPGNVRDGIVNITDDGEVGLVAGSPIDTMLVNHP